MDLAYDHIAEESYGSDRAPTPTPPKTDATHITAPAPANLQAEFQETFRAFSSSPWGAKLGGFWGNVRKQGESYYEGARKEAEAASEEALKGFTGLKESIVNRTRSLSFGESQKPAVDDAKAEDAAVDAANDKTLQDNETFIARFKSEAAKRLKEIEKAEDAADEALLKFGTNIRNFLRDAVAVAAPDTTGANDSTVLFESKDAAGKRVIHTSRFDAQLHVVHTTLSSFTADPTTSGEQWSKFKEGFQIDQKTETIAQDLEKYPDLRATMEKLVPEKVEYKDFWCRYYFLRHVIEAQEERRKEMLKASSDETEEVGWDEESDEEQTSKTPPITQKHQVISQKANGSTTTIQKAPDSTESLKPRRSHDEKSVADSDASYDLVSGATSRTPGSPKEEKPTAVKEESDEEDWE